MNSKKQAIKDFSIVSNEQHIDFESLFIGVNSHAIIAVTDKFGKIVYVNQSFCEISFYNQSELIGQNHKIINSGFHSKEFFKNLWQTISSGQKWHGEIKNKTKIGTYYWVDTTIVPLLDSDGNISRFISIRTDITPYKTMLEKFKVLNFELQTKNVIQKKELRAQKEINKSNVIENEILTSSLEYEEKILNTLNFISFTATNAINSKEMINTVIQKICKNFDWQVGHIFSINDESKYHTQDIWITNGNIDLNNFKNDAKYFLDVHKEFYYKIIPEDNSPQLIENFEIYKNIVPTDFSKNRKFNFKSILLVPVILDGKIKHIIELFSYWEKNKNTKFCDFMKATGTQISSVCEREHYIEKIKFEEQKRNESSKFSALGQMIGGMAHEINNPLTYISVKLKLLLTAILDKKINADTIPVEIQKILDVTKRIEIIIRTLLNFSHNSEDAPKISYPLKNLVEESLIFCRERFKNHNVTLNVCTIPDHIIINCQPIQISQVILNLLNNAFDALEKSETKLIQIDFEEDLNNYMLSVLDSGAGVPVSIQKQIFEPFFTTKEVGKGTGLGLSLSKSFILAHHGSLELSLKNNKTCFTIKLPKKGT